LNCCVCHFCRTINSDHGTKLHLADMLSTVAATVFAIVHTLSTTCVVAINPGTPTKASPVDAFVRGYRGRGLWS